MSSDATKTDGPLSSSLEKLRGELDRWFEAAMSQGNRAMDAIGIRPGGAWCPPIDVVEDSESVRVYVNLPGAVPDLIDLSLAGHMLTVSGLVAAIDLSEGAEQHTSERPHGEFKRSVPLPASVDPEKVSAESKNGVLIVTVGKCESEKARKVPIRSGETAETASA